MRNIHEMFSQWRKFLSNDKLLTEIKNETIVSEYAKALEYIDNLVKSKKSAFYCLNLLIENLSSYTKYLEIPETPDKTFLGFRLKNEILNSKESELTDENVKSLITFTYQCLEVLLDKMPELKTENALLNLRKNIKEEGLQNGTV